MSATTVRSDHRSSPLRSRAVVHEAPHRVGLGEFEVRPLTRGEVLVRAAYTCISPGTELRCLAGRQPDGADFPYIPGYAMSGEVVEVGPETALVPGQRVYLNGTSDGGRCNLMWGGHAAHAVAPETACLPIPDDVGMDQASLTHLAAIAYNGVLMADVRPGEVVAVIGLGILGRLCAGLYTAAGSRVVAIDRNPERVRLACVGGIEAVVAEERPAAAIRSLVPDGADVIADVSGAPDVLAAALDSARDVPWSDPTVRGARYVVQGSYPEAFCIPYQAAFLKELRILLPRDCRLEQRRRVLEMMAAGDLSTEGLISDIRPPERASETYRELAAGTSPLLTVAFDWS